jgi:hypothetical protein
MIEQSSVLAGLREAVASLDQRILELDKKVDKKLDALESKMSTQFLWLVGVQISALLAFVGGVIALLKR